MNCRKAIKDLFDDRELVERECKPFAFRSRQIDAMVNANSFITMSYDIGFYGFVAVSDSF